MLTGKYKRRLQLLHISPWICLVGIIVMFAGPFFVQTSNNLALAIMGIGGLISLGSIALNKFCAGLHSDDERLLEDADKGLCILLTADQYLALNQADPERYPMDYSYIVLKLGSIMGDKTPVKMLSGECDKLTDIINNKDQAIEEAARSAACLEELQIMRRTLEAHIEAQETKNAETAAAIQAQVAKIIEADSVVTATGQVAQGL